MKQTIDDSDFYAIAQDRGYEDFWGDAGFERPKTCMSIQGAYKFSTRKDAEKTIKRYADCADKGTNVVRVNLHTDATFYTDGDNEKSYCRLLEISPDYLAEIICDLNTNGPISQDYIFPIADKIVEDVAQDIYETTDAVNWSNDDVRLAVGRVLCKKLRIKI